MNPVSRLGCSLVASLVLWIPTLQACMRGDTDLFTASIRYLVAFGLSMLAVSVLSQLVTGYAALQTADEPAPEPGSPVGRRREDIEPALAADD